MRYNIVLQDGLNQTAYPDYRLTSSSGKKTRYKTTEKPGQTRKYGSTKISDKIATGTVLQPIL